MGADAQVFLYVACGMAIAVLSFVVYCIARLKCQEKDLIRKRLMDRQRSSSSFSAEPPGVAGGYDERPLEGLPDTEGAAAGVEMTSAGATDMSQASDQPTPE
jgi:hypothetical protein